MDYGTDRGGQTKCFLKFANPQILELIPLSQIRKSFGVQVQVRKYLWLIRNFFFRINPKIEKPKFPQHIAELCLKTVLKFVSSYLQLLLELFLCTVLN
jgi:hypothetical protein